MSSLQPALATTIAAFHILGLASALHAVRYSRTSQGALAWVFSLILVPYVAIPLYWLFGPRRFELYLSVLKEAKGEHSLGVDNYRSFVSKFKAPLANNRAQSLFENLFAWPPTSGNKVSLLIDGEETFRAMLDEMQKAEKYLLIQFYIFRDDNLGQRFKEVILDRRNAGVSIYMLLDSVGSMEISNGYISELREAGVELCFFGATRGLFSRFSVNFRNHRKIVVVDGRLSFVGGLNVGDEYLGKSEQFGKWRDTHVCIVGPATRVVQASFVEDWYYITGGGVPSLEVEEIEPAGDSTVLPFYTGPTSVVEDCSLVFMEAIASAEDRFWITSPYFVPNEALAHSLQLAALRGRDVRLLLPLNPDHLIVGLANFSYFEEMLSAGVKIFLYKEGFLHQKVFLVDDEWSCVGTTNLDNRSLSLNFEISLMVFDKPFAKLVAEMLENDFEASLQFTSDDLAMASLSKKLASRVARLASPVL